MRSGNRDQATSCIKIHSKGIQNSKCLQMNVDMLQHFESFSENAMTPAQFDLARSGLHAPAPQVQFVAY